MLPRDERGRADLWPAFQVVALMSAIFLAYCVL